MAGIEFRDYQDKDATILPDLFIRAIQTIYSDLEDGEWTRGLHYIEVTYLETGGAFRVAEDQDGIVAMAGLKRVNDNTGEMVRVAVEPDRQDKGIGQSLVEDIEARARELGLTQI